MSTFPGHTDEISFGDPFADDQPTQDPQGELRPVEDNDEPDTDEDNDEPDTDTGGDPSRRARATARRRSADKNLIRRAAVKVLELTNADPDDRRLLAAVLGVDDDPVQLTVAVLSADRNALTGIQEILDLADTNPIERGVVLMSLGRPKMRAIWQMYTDLGVDGIDGNIPGVDAKAAMALAKAELDGEVRARLGRVTELAKRG